MNEVQFKLRLFIVSLLTTLFSFSMANAQTVGVTADKILVGSSVNMTGPSNDRPREIMRGSEIVFKKINASGGIHGRKIETLIYDDAYEPAKSLENAKKLTNVDKVFALFGFFGAPNSKAVQPYVTSADIPFIAPGSGVESLRQPVVKNIFNIRLSYAQEVEPLVDYIVKLKKIKEVAILYQDDALGKEVLDGTKAALKKHGGELKAAASWARSNDDSVNGAFETIKKSGAKAVILGVVFKPAAEFARKAKEAGLDLVLVGPTSLASGTFVKEVGAAGEGIVVSSGFPLTDSKLDLIKQFKADADAVGMKEPANIEGYLSALVFVEGLKRAGKNLTRENLYEAFHNMKDVNFGGMKVTFAPDRHQALTTAFLGEIKSGKLITIQE